MATTDIVRIADGADSPYELMRITQAEIQELVGEALAPGETLGLGDLTRIKVPAGGSTTWAIPDPLAGTEVETKEITGIILRADTRRGYWKDAYDGSNDPPDCGSDDGVTGVPNDESEHPGPGGACADCPFNEFGSAENGIGKACKESRLLFVLTEDSILPVVIGVPPASLAPLKAYRVGLLRTKRKLAGVVTKLTLEKAENAGGIKYGRIIPAMAAELEPEAAAKVAAYAEILAPAMSRVQLQRDDVDMGEEA